MTLYHNFCSACAVTVVIFGQWSRFTFPFSVKLVAVLSLKVFPIPNDLRVEFNKCNNQEKCYNQWQVAVEAAPWEPHQGDPAADVTQTARHELRSDLEPAQPPSHMQ